MAPPGMASLGRARLGEAARGGELEKPAGERFIESLARVATPTRGSAMLGGAWLGKAWLGGAGHRWARRGTARQGEGCSQPIGH